MMATNGRKTARNTKAAASAGAKISAAATKTAAAGADPMERSATDFYSKFEVPELFRSFTEQGLSQARETYSRIRAAAEENTDVLEDSLDVTREGLREMQFKALDVTKSNLDAAFDLYRQLLSTRSFGDAVQLQTAFARERFDVMLDYSRDVQSTLSKVGAEAAKPAKSMLERTLTTAKAA